MSTNNNKTVNKEFCKSSFNVEGQEIINTYRCNQKPFAASDIWKIQSQRKQVSVGLNITVQ